MANVTCKGYHATAKENIKSILTNGFYMSKPKSSHWLGKGIYFFEDLYYAVEWQIIGVLKREVEEFDELNRKSGIIVSEIDMENYETLNISEPYGYSIFKELLDLIKKYYSNSEYEENLKKGDIHLIKVLEQIEIETGQKNLSNFDVLCSIYPKPIELEEAKSKTGDFMKCAQKQICVKNKKAIIKSKEYDNNKLKKENFELLIKNRRNLK